MKYLEQIATESFFALTGSLDLTEHHIKSFPKVTPSKGPNFHKFKMAANSPWASRGYWYQSGGGGGGGSKITLIL